MLDGLRGVAVTLVIASHAFPMVHALPWAIKRFSNLGFFGVQLFFVVSCITLANSWRRGQRAGAPSLRNFALRRVFRIAPAYFLAAIFYAWLIPHGPIDPERVITFVTFTSGWTPAQMPTVQGAWVCVPGGWSIEAEFAFYALFPILMSALPGLRRALAAFLLSLPLAWIINGVATSSYQPIYGAAATDQFLYYWLPNQLPVFLCGLAAFEVIVKLMPGGRWQSTAARFARLSPLVLALSLAAFLALAMFPWPRLPAPGHLFLPTHVIAALAFSAATVAFVVRPMAMIVNPLIVRIGQASFSAYLVHFAIIALLEKLCPSWIFAQTGVFAALCSLFAFLGVFAITAALAQLTYRFIELPAIQLGTRVISLSEPALPQGG